MLLNGCFSPSLAFGEVNLEVVTISDISVLHDLRQILPSPSQILRKRVPIACSGVRFPLVFYCQNCSALPNEALAEQEVGCSLVADVFCKI